MKTRYSVVLAALAASLFGVPAMAASSSTSNSTSTAQGVGQANNAGIGTSSSTSGSAATSGSVANGGTSNGYAGSVVNFTYTGDPGSSDPGGSSGGDPTEHLITTGTQRVVTVGAAIAPSIYSNNVCALSASAAGGFMGGAFALGFDRVDKNCDVRANASLLGHFAEIYAIAAEHSPDPQTRAIAEHEAAIYAQWANNYLCMANPDLAAAAPPGANFCHTVATQVGLQVVPGPVTHAQLPPQPVVARPVALQQAAADPPPKPKYEGPHMYGSHEGAVPSSWHTGPISGYQGPDYSDD